MKKIILLILGLIILAGCQATGNAVKDSNDGFIKIPLSDVSKVLIKYDYNANGIDVKYFIVLGSDGQVRTAFDACDVCGGKKGYMQRGTDVVCNNCGKVFRIDDIGTKNGPGGCWPSFLDHKLEGDNILISKAELAKGAFRFR
jgi:uncharacterized membrane protein